MVAERGISPHQERIPEKICEQIVDVHVPQDVSAQDSKPRPNLAVYSGANSRCSCALEGGAVGESAEDRIPRQNPAANCGADR